MTTETVTVDGRDLEVLRHGAPDAFPLVFHCGTPNAPAAFPQLFDAVDAAGWQLVAHARPGYATSTRHEGRSVADVASDVAAILDRLGLGEFVVLGWSGGGPHALACAALLPDRCRGAASLAGVAPYDAEGLEFLAGMGPENVAEFGAAARSHEELRAFLGRFAAALRDITGEQVAGELGGLIDDVDRGALTGEFAESLARMLRHAVSTGIDGWFDDDLAFVKPWGFALDGLSVPVSIWQGAHDRMVPFAHGRWLAAHVPNARVHLYDDEGHLSLVNQLPRILDDLSAR
ncbi:MAG TPA: alpha/beta fold hydrolase [Solirubrobacteraceae bacterium]|jgi:pimeloyl-ACP methyl ester carboxylesterase|nr:alpha/beta fold hydrolase [Solirubrobacteraceae bacterium]